MYYLFNIEMIFAFRPSPKPSEKPTLQLTLAKLSTFRRLHLLIENMTVNLLKRIKGKNDVKMKRDEMNQLLLYNIFITINILVRKVLSAFDGCSTSQIYSKSLNVLKRVYLLFVSLLLPDCALKL